MSSNLNNYLHDSHSKHNRLDFIDDEETLMFYLRYCYRKFLYNPSLSSIERKINKVKVIHISH